MDSSDSAGARSLSFVADNMELFGFTSPPAGFTQMVKELVDNALDATRGLQDRPTGVQVNITRQQAQTGPHVLNAAGLPIVESSGQRGSLWWLEINVTDNGIGIASATQLGVFDSSKRSQGGVGTGTSGRFGVGLIASVIFVSRTSHQAEFTITSSQGSQEVRVSRYRYDPVLETLATESEVFSGMEDTASGTQVQVRCLLPKWAVDEAMPRVLEYVQRMQLSLLPPCFDFVCDGLWNDTSLCFEHDEEAAPLLSQGATISTIFRDARRAELSEAFRRRVHDYLGYALDDDNDDSLAISIRDEYMVGQPERTEVITALWLDVRTADEEEKAGSISGDVIRLVNHVPLLDHPDWRSGVVMEACNAVDWARFGLKLVATMVDEDMGVKARLELVSRKSEQELQPGEQYIARLMLVLDLVIETVRFNSAAKTYVVPSEALTHTIASGITACLRQLKQAYPALLRTSAELQDEHIRVHCIPGVAGALADMIASSHSVGFQEACLQVLQKPVESIRKPVMCASILELMEWKARRSLG